MGYFANEIIQGGGEGVILRQPKSVYQPGISKSVLKFKIKIKITGIEAWISQCLQN
jgi:ATP-dependent DNA ligase